MSCGFSHFCLSLLFFPSKPKHIGRDFFELVSFSHFYFSICMQIEHFYIHAIFLCKFVSQAIVSNHLKQIISNTNQYALSCQSYPKFKSFRNYSNILEIERV